MIEQAQENKKYDVIIIGGGPAGLTAGIYSARRELKTLILTRDIGGQITKTNIIENYPGFELISGLDLAKKMYDQAKKCGAEIQFNEAKKITKTDTGFSVDIGKATYDARAIILAFGKKPRELGVPGEEKLKGSGVSYCATCDVPFFKNKTLVVVGGGNSALCTAVIAADVAKKVYLIYRGTELRGEQVMQDKLRKMDHVEILYNEEVSEIIGEEKVEQVTLKSGKTLETDGIIIEIGFVIDRALADGLVKMDEKNQIIISTNQETSVPGIFAAGDLTETPAKQIVIATGEGAKAALAAYDYLQRLEGKKGILADWH